MAKKKTLQDMRLEIGWTQKKMAECLGWERSVLARLEVGDRDWLPIHMAKQLADFYSLSLDQIAGVWQTTKDHYAKTS